MTEQILKPGRHEYRPWEFNEDDPQSQALEYRWRENNLEEEGAREAYEEATEIVMRLVVPPEAIDALQDKEELTKAAGFAQFDEYRERPTGDPVRVLKELRMQQALFAGGEAPFSEYREGLASVDYLAQQFYEDATTDEAMAKKQAALSAALQTLYGRDRLEGAKNETGYFPSARPPKQIEHFDSLKRSERGIYTQQLFNGEAFSVNNDSPLLTEEEVLARYKIEDSSLLAIIKIGEVSGNIGSAHFGVFYTHNTSGDVRYELRYKPNINEKDHIKRYAPAELQGDFLRCAESLSDDADKVTNIGTSTRRNSGTLEAMIQDVDEDLKEKTNGYVSLSLPEGFVAPYHLRLINEGNRLVIHNDPDVDVEGATMVQSALLPTTHLNEHPQQEAYTALQN